jgi:hypothetical protein
MAWRTADSTWGSNFSAWLKVKNLGIKSLKHAAAADSLDWQNSR